MTVVAPRKYDPVLSLIKDALRTFDTPARGQTQKEQAKDEGRKQGLLQGLCSGISTHITMRRLALYEHPMANSVPVLDEWEIRKSIGGGDLWKLEDQRQVKVAAIKADGSITNEQKREQQDLANKHFIESVQMIVEEWVRISPDFAASYEGHRRELVLLGEVEPRVDDENWIAERIEQAQSEAKELERLLTKAQTESR